MDRWATKDFHEREEEEAERLMRPAPKVKPPRHDKRREDTRPDRDPDVEGDPDLKGDPDLSLNYKTIGGRVLQRWLRRAEIERASEPEEERIKVRRKDTGKVVYVTKDGLKKAPGKYDKFEEREDAPEAEKPETGGEDAFFYEKGEKLRQKAKDEPYFKGLLDNFDRGTGQGARLMRQNPNIPAATYLGYTSAYLPKGIKTLGDLHRAITSERPDEDEEPEKKEEPKSEEAKPEAKEPKAKPEPPKPEEKPEEPDPEAEAKAKEKGEKADAKRKKDEKAVQRKKDVAALKDLSKADPKTAQILRALADPESDLHQQVAQKGDKGVESIKALKDVKLPKTIESVQDLLEATAELHKPLPPPEGREVTRQERRRAETAIADTFPEHIAEALNDKDLHPDEVGQLINEYRKAKEVPLRNADVDKFATQIAQHYVTDPDKVPVSEEVEKLPPEEQAEAQRKHAIRMVALSLAARERIAESIQSNSGIRRSLAEHLAENMLRSTPGESEEEASSRGDQHAEKFFKESLSSGLPAEPMSDGDIKQLLKAVGNNATAKKLAVAYAQAQDYKEARQRFLDTGSKEHINEWDDPQVIANGIGKASKFLSDRAKRYPDDAKVQDVGMEFRHRVMDRLRALTPEKYPLVQGRLNDYEAADYESAKKKYEREEKQHEAEVAKATRQFEKDKAKAEKKRLKTPGGGEEPVILPVEERLKQKGVRAPREPVKPPLYDWWTGKAQEEGKSLWDKLLKPRKSAALVERVLFGHLSAKYSSYPGGLAMGSTPDRVRTAVYWGAAPYPAGHEGFAPYSEWTQAHARDLGAKDYDAILTAAREWLRAPILTAGVEGIYRDTQLRAALDLAIRDYDGGKYSVGLYPTVYNNLLAKLGGQSPNDTLLSDHEQRQASQSTYGVSPGEVLNMKPSAQISAFAARLASKDPVLAYELVDFATKLAEEEEKKEGGQGQGQEQQAKQAAVNIAAQNQLKYQSLRSLIIRTASSHPEAREAFMPLLSAVKQG